MLTIEQDFYSEIEIKKSKFISYIFPNKNNQNFDIYLNKLKTEHYKAKHFVTAFRYKNSYKQIIEGSSDNGEPRGTSGKPTLNVLIGDDLIDIGVITVRYFGGTKLGTGGLVSAYSDAIHSTIKISHLIQTRDLIESELFINYKNITRFKALINKFNCFILNENFNETGAFFKISCEEQNIFQLKNY
jgi:uncharacterized YigZ family protein